MTNERRDYIPSDRIVGDVNSALASRRTEEIDWITFVGSGEPLLHAELGRMIRDVKSLTDRPVAVITNGGLLQRPGIREEVRAADAVLPSLDAGSEALYKKINRSLPELTFERHVQGLIAFRESYAGKLWVEVMLLRALNDSEAALEDLAAALRRIAPDEVHLNLPIRIPAEPWVEPPDDEGLMRAAAILGDAVRVIRPAEGAFDLSGHGTVTDAIVAVITRHPMRQEELVDTLRDWNADEVARALADLAADGRARQVSRCGVRFWTSASATYAGKENPPHRCSR
jgi:wyosine [tRNA(Phe)-imidazoG37] synthetase (radical SAM superfamily)